MSVGENVRRRREELELSLTSVSKVAGISSATLHDLETKPNVRPSAELLYQVSRVLECSIEYLLDVPRLPCRVSTRGNALALENLKLKKRLKRIADAIRDTERLTPVEHSAAPDGLQPRVS